jgi:hypothetical protein
MAVVALIFARGLGTLLKHIGDLFNAARQADES